MVYNFEIHLKIKYLTNFSETSHFCRELTGEYNKKKISNNGSFQPEIFAVNDGIYEFFLHIHDLTLT